MWTNKSSSNPKRVKLDWEYHEEGVKTTCPIALTTVGYQIGYHVTFKRRGHTTGPEKISNKTNIMF